MCELLLSSERESYMIHCFVQSQSVSSNNPHCSSEMFQKHHQYENVRPVSSDDRVRNVRMEIRPGSDLAQSAADTQRVKISPGQAYENVSVIESEAGVRHQLPDQDPFEGFEEAIKNSEVISIKKVLIFCIIVINL